MLKKILFVKRLCSLAAKIIKLKNMKQFKMGVQNSLLS